MRKPIIAGNWKMHKTIAEAVEFVNEIKGKLNDEVVDAVICAPFTLLKDLKDMQEVEKETGRQYFNTQLFAIRVREIYKILKESGE